MKNFNAEDLLKNIDDIEIIKKLPNEYLVEKVVLGIDIYKYSQYPSIEQIYIPVLFESLYSITVSNLVQREPFIFFNYGKGLPDFKKNFISTGDGGFQIFDNPIQAVLFALYFQINIRRYCSGASPHPLLKKLFKIINLIELRYAITSEIIYSYKSNFFGAAIINNARILSKDNLNRLLIDSNTNNWFSTNINSIENLIDVDKKSFLKTAYFKGYDGKLESLLFEKNGCFKSVDILKIGKIEAKYTSLDIYNLHIQVLIRLAIEKHDYDMYMVTLGNLNTTGIE